MVLFPEERVGSWMKFIFPMPTSDQVQNYSLNIRNLKKENIAWQSRRLASRRLVRSMLQVQLASRKLVRTPSAFHPAKRLFTHKDHSYDEGKWTVIRQSDASLHWDAIGPVLLNAFAKHGARDFSGEQWLRLCHEGSSKTRFEYCEDSQNSLAYFWAIQGHSGGIPFDPELMVYIRIPYNWKKYIYHSGTVQFGQTKSHAIIVHEPVPAECIYKVIPQSGDRILFERLSTPTTRAKSHTEKQLAIAAAAATAAAVHNVMMCRPAQGNVLRIKLG